MTRTDKLTRQSLNKRTPCITSWFVIIILLLTTEISINPLFSAFYNNLGDLELIHSESTVPTSVSVRARDYFLLSDQFSSSWLAKINLWYWYSLQSRCEESAPLLRTLIDSRPASLLVKTRVAYNIKLQYCVMKQYDQLGLSAEKSLVVNQMQHFTSTLLTYSRMRHTGLQMLPSLVAEGVWPMDYAYRLMAFSVSYPSDDSLLLDAIKELLIYNPTNAEIAYLASLYFAKMGEDQLAETCFRSAQRMVPDQYPNCAFIKPMQGLVDGNETKKSNSDRILYREGFETLNQRGQPRDWEWNAGWVGGSKFEDGLFWWMSDPVYYVEGARSLRISGIWKQADFTKETARAGFYSGRILFGRSPAKAYRLAFFYRTIDLKDGEAIVELQKDDRTVVLWALPSTRGCWKKFTVTFSAERSAGARFLIRVAGIGDVWFDALEIEKLSVN